ncbi:MAG: hypothetical protein KDC43_02990, partial [Saprospiraceae bacterium]|nr:hypothetical protein [Saprospiraceae bacterium]
MKRPFVQLLWIAAFLPWLAWSCQPAPAGTENDQLLAKVHNKTLYLSELEGMIPESSSSEDS